MTEFLARLKQRKLVQWAIAYVAFAFALLQGLDVFAQEFAWSPAWMRGISLALVVGFFVVLVVAWYHGEKGRQRVSGAELLLIALVLGIGGAAVWYFGKAGSPAAAKPAATIAQAMVALKTSPITAAAPVPFNPPADSIVVLPFANLSGDPKQRYFSDGITQELTGALGQNTGLTVIAWETASRYADSKQTPTEIGKALNVAHILDGSIQREGDEVRVSVELVNTVTGQELWSSHYDDSLKNIFAVQDKITGAIADSLKVKFAGMQAAPTLNPQAHELYLKGLAAQDRYTVQDVQTAQDYFLQALKLDPNYADARAGLAYTYLQLSQISTVPLQDALPKIRAAAQEALKLDPHNVDALVELGNADDVDNRIPQARAEYRQALKLDPSNAHAHMDYGLVLPVKASLAQMQQAVRLDPDKVVSQQNLAFAYADTEDWPQMAAAAQKMIGLSPHDVDGVFLLAYAYTQMRRGEDAAKVFDLTQPATTLDNQLVDAGRLTYQALLQPTLRTEALGRLNNLRRAKFSPLSYFNLLQLYLALSEKMVALQMLPDLCTADPVFCNDLAVNPMFALLHGDPRFEKLSKRYTTITPQ